MIRELRSAGELRSACGDDDLVMWAGQGLRGGARAWALGDAVVAAGPGLALRDRLAVWGGVSCAVDLVRHALGEVGPSYRPVGDAELVRDVVVKLDGLEESGRFSWMSLSAPALASASARGFGSVVCGPVERGGVGAAGWLGVEEEGEVAALLAADAPHSYAVPGGAGVRRWAGVRVDGVLGAVAADAWSAPAVGLLAGVA
uniref:hypothetical protein n=1 Tax=Nonomuraea candida TaxID=359159 RepID=UPI000694ED28